jgi:hypothetical protein
MKISTKLAWVALGGMVLAASPAHAGKKDAPVTPISIPTPPEGKGQIVFFRPGGMGAAIRCTVRENGAMVTRVMGNRYDVIVAEPGPHSYTTKTESTDTVNVEVEPGETTFVKCTIAMGIMAGRPNLSPSTKVEFDGKSKKLRPVDAAKIAADLEEDKKRRATGEKTD